ncbi:MAG TPA: hypothetical protein VEW48_00410 [Thermoanaerobaculia bacterium]|nr:hypothetical protein [Thermoanaerobaculia bacterium]
MLIKLGVLVREIVLAFAFGLLAGGKFEDYAAFKMKNSGWLGPVFAGLLCFFASWWVAKGARGRQILHGTVVGVVVLLIEIAFGARFRTWPDFLGEVGVVIGASWLGGWVAARRAAQQQLS